mmetsp:Transcript_20783/g.26891  ORF Transcript_20783/g.26891 Transcript_20783/m.26891 type:complete len:511 (+) Transcript_20783:41-1573(+)|eukprot:CAMPEP_0197312834 /NCGR_PEP_ID=MMETSP0891-20130614/23508_1 /TAXON_ID=44058 ORGANISM="Aureoumbra lagunensis, Strain CCMP1510" /NCGR_SAMPLE_ID=MMETSP0891 /ASSEMBLY_ACC=CAM_ASM_000534 /LENGTH=510 /DNA_ID=CAMNT_0042800295 /DNA_START=1 /DNA_END=1536 /DNA_ORIENTATION=+
MSAVVPGVSDVEFLSSRELISLVLRRTGEAVEIEELESSEKLYETARRAVLSHLSVSELRGLVTEAGLSTRDCITKGDLRIRAVEAVKRLRLAKKLPTRAETIQILEKRIRNTYKRYEITFEGKKLGFSIGMLTKASTGEKWVVATHVSRSDLPALQPGDEVLYIEDAPFAPCRTSAQFREAVTARIQDAPRPLKMTFATGDGRWPPDKPSRHELALRKIKKRRKASEKTSTNPQSDNSRQDKEKKWLSSNFYQQAQEKQDLPNTNNVNTMTIKELRTTIERAGMTHKTIIEKAELRIVAEEALRRIERQNRPPSKNWEAFVAEQRRKAEQYKQQNQDIAATLAQAAISLGSVDETEEFQTPQQNNAVSSPDQKPTLRKKPPPPPPPREKNKTNKPLPPPEPERQAHTAEDHTIPTTHLKEQQQRPSSPKDQLESVLNSMPSFFATDDDADLTLSHEKQVDDDDDDSTWNSHEDTSDQSLSRGGSGPISKDAHAVTTTAFGVNITHSCEM